MNKEDLIFNLSETIKEGDKFEELTYEVNEYYGKCKLIKNKITNSLAEIIVYFENFDAYIRLTGHYNQFEGVEWNNDFKEVVPKQATFVVYE